MTQRKTRQRSLAWRLYGIGVVQMMFVAFAAIMMPRWVFGRHHPPPHREIWVPHHQHFHHIHPPERPWLLPLATLFWGLAIVGVGAFWAARGIIKPLRRLERHARTLGEGRLDVRSGFIDDDEIGAVGLAFDDMASRLQAQLQAEKELLANVSHELRTPVARMRVALDLAKESHGDAQKATLAEIELDIAELETLLDDILMLRRAETTAERAGGFPLKRQDTSAGQLCQHVVELFEQRHPKRPISLEVQSDLPSLLLDFKLFSRALENILENAHRYSPDENAAITLRVEKRENYICFAIADHGQGISETDLPHIFTPLYRAERSRSRGAGGVGLGLTLVKRIVEAHMGNINITSQLGQGTTVYIDIPNPS